MEYTDEYILKKEELTAIADTIRYKTNSTVLITIDQMPSKINEVYETGYNNYISVIWDTLQSGGTKRNYDSYFGNARWTDEAFKPIYDLIVTSAKQMFFKCSITNLKQILQERGVVLDTSGATLFTEMFKQSTITHVPTIDLSGCTNITQAFAYTPIEEIEKIISTATVPWNNTFASVLSLKKVVFEGVIGSNGLNLSGSPLLDKESLTSVINCLSTTTTGLTVTLSLTAVNKAFETSEGANDGSTSAEWLELIDSKVQDENNSKEYYWIISLV